MKLALTVPDRKGKWWRCEQVWLACSTTGSHAASLGLKQLSGTPSFPHVVAFSGWMMVIERDVKKEWNGQGQIKSSSTQQNTREAPYNGIILMEDICFSLTSSLSNGGPPVRRGPLPWVTPCSTSVSKSCEWKCSVPLLKHITLHLWPSAVWTQPTTEQLVANTQKKRDQNFKGSTNLPHLEWCQCQYQWW